MTEQNEGNNNGLHLRPQKRDAGERLDAASKSLSEALRISFIILKIIMIVLVVVFLASGIRTVGPDEEALVLRFGKIRGVGEERILGPGLKILYPYPIHEILRIPVSKKINLSIDSFWYFQTKREMLPESPKGPVRVGPALNPIRDGYCITRSEKQDRSSLGFSGSDYNIVHCKWQLTYQIGDSERFFKNTYTDDVKPGESYAEVIEKSITPLLRDLVEDSVVSAMVHYSIDEAVRSRDTIPQHVKKLLQEKLDEIESGITVISVQLTEMQWPRQVDRAFWNFFRASQARDKRIAEANRDAEKTLNEAEGLVAEKLAEARAYKTEVVEAVEASAKYLQRMLPEYRKRPELVLKRIYQDTIEQVLNSADEKLIIQPTQGAEGPEIWILLNRDPKLKPKFEKEQ